MIPTLSIPTLLRMGLPWIMETSVLKESGALIRFFQGRPFRFLQHINGDVDSVDMAQAHDDDDPAAVLRIISTRNSQFDSIPKWICLSNLKYKTTQNYAHSGDIPFRGAQMLEVREPTPVRLPKIVPQAPGGFRSGKVKLQQIQDKYHQKYSNEYKKSYYLHLFTSIYYQ